MGKNYVQCVALWFSYVTLHMQASLDIIRRTLTLNPLPITFLSSNKDPVLGQVLLKSCGWKERQQRRRPALICAALKTIILLSTQTILSKWSCPHHSQVSTMWWEIILRSSQRTQIQDKGFREKKQTKCTYKNQRGTFFHIHCDPLCSWMLLLSQYLLYALHFDFYSGIH